MAKSESFDVEGLKRQGDFLMSRPGMLRVGAELRSAAKHIEAMEFVLSSIVRDLPQKRDWLDPSIEKQARDLLGGPTK
ncbi:hypothetical protein [Bremerella sp. P1]|uniref:hypothetical protein n=1 Tax=Bremerella sp. P1 TaxID=3026424 RepID=UPI002367D971|nr:hypothetical protein [Bremerella sp. P1]WDI44755.1 hypothetical protein PSR63_12495 [Bremerella sp. P1]